MSEWHGAGYFNNDLELRVEVGSKVCHVTLGELIQLNNGQIPFNISSNLLQLPQQQVSGDVKILIFANVGN